MGEDTNIVTIKVKLEDPFLVRWLRSGYKVLDNEATVRIIINDLNCLKEEILLSREIQPKHIVKFVCLRYYSHESSYICEEKGISLLREVEDLLMGDKEKAVRSKYNALVGQGKSLEEIYEGNYV